MAESLSICNPQTNKPGEGFQRRIEFHIARKPCSAYYTSTNSNKFDGDFHLETLNPSSDSKRPASSMVAAGKRSDGGDSAEHGWLDPELSFGITFRRIGAGLANLGNTCFLNSVLQCLTYTEPFAAYLQSGKHKSSCHTAGFCAMCAIQNHVSSALQSTGKILSPSHLVKNLRCISRNFRNSRQEDAHEYMVNLLESMHKCCLPSGVPSESPSAYEKSLVHKIFGGRLRSQVKCMQCSYCSNTFDPFLDLSLEIVKADSLCKALAHFTAMEQLDGGEKQYQCQRCKEKVKALKQLTVHKAPYVLSIHLKRFGSHVPGQKINRKVDFGPTLDLKPFVSDPYEGDLKYTLYGVLVHAGYSTHSGHYYCFVRTSSGMWHTLDDNRVFQVSEKTVLQQKAYMLFYVRDRRNSAPKKPLDVVHKGHMAGNGSTQNKKFPIFTSSTKQTIQHGLMERRLSTSECSATSTITDAFTAHGQSISVAGAASVGSLSKEASVLQTSIQVVAEGLRQSALSKEPTMGLPLKDPLLKQPSLKSSLLNMPGSSQNDCSGFQNHSPAKLLTENGIHETADVLKKRKPNDRLCKSNNLKSEKIGSQLLSHQSSIGNGCINVETLSATQTRHRIPDQKGSIVNGSSSELSWQNAGDSDLKSKETGSVKLSSQKEALDTKPKPKKIAKCHLVRSINAGGKLLLFSSLGLRKRKKHKRTKHCGLGVRNFSQKDSMEDFISRDRGTSTSARFVDVDNGNGHGAPKGVEISNGCTMNLKERDLGVRSGQNSAVLATDGPPVKFSLSIERNDRENRGSFQNGLMSILTRGLEATVVARWDDVELPSSEMYGTLDAPNSGIGYIPDEWDEEYDRGKRKKVRKSSQYFGGHNPFQEIATMEAQSKKMKTDQTSSGNRPFRI